jgi:hypothetical protein
MEQTTKNTQKQRINVIFCTYFFLYMLFLSPLALKNFFSLPMDKIEWFVKPKISAIGKVRFWGSRYQKE